ncbi:MAG: DUF58 domain-containing protein [Planctomycetes bacterium]|nr:DUF58 domain-containing protein [Planctomycetota bacterium]
MQSRFLDPAGLARVGNMPLVAKQVVEGFLTGRHRSPYHGFSVEFLDHRAYTPGDDLRGMDWKIVARTNKYYVKLFEDETNLRAYILLDCSRSMAFNSGEVDKLTYGGQLAAALAYMLLRQNDAVGLVTFDTGIRDFIPAKAHPSQFRRIVSSLDGMEPGGETDVGVVLHDVAERIKRRSLVIVISDMLDDESRLADGLQHFRHNRHEVLALQVMDPAELDFPFTRMTRFKDIEGTSRMIANPKRMRQRYLERMQRFITNIKTKCLERRISYELANTSQPYDRFLAAYLDKRSRM